LLILGLGFLKIPTISIALVKFSSYIRSALNKVISEPTFHNPPLQVMDDHQELFCGI